MSLEDVIQENTAAIHKLIEALVSAGMTQQAAVRTTLHQVAEESFTKPETQKKEPAAKKVAAAASSPSTVKPPVTAPAEDVPDPVGEVKKLNYAADVRPRLMALVEAKGNAVLVDLLSRYGVAKASDVKQDQLAALLADAEKVIAGEMNPSDSLV